MKTCTVYSSEPATMKYGGDRFNKELKKWVTKDNEKQSKEPDFKKGNEIMYTIKDSNGNTCPVARLSERVYESKEHKTLFITDEEGTAVGIYKEK